MQHLDNPGLLQDLLTLTEHMISTNDVDFLLSNILTQARRLARAEAGSIFLVEGDNLRFVYVQNDVLDTGGKGSYVDQLMPLNKSSLAGYTAVTGMPLIIDDVYQIPESAPYGFNRTFDQKTGYRTRSMLVTPMETSRGKMVGVLQLINARGENEKVKTFEDRDVMLANYCAANGAIVLERALITRELILRTMRMAELRDPKETGPHVNRVGGVAAVIFEHMARAMGKDPDTVRRDTDLVRVAAMLHDVGKVAISDTILKKPGKLTDEEFAVIKLHTLAGAQLFKEEASELDHMAQTIALRHHERWDGKGYPGDVPDPRDPAAVPGKGLVGDQTPLPARITAVADVYDALISARVYKPAFTENKVLSIIREESGAQFDPTVVKAFFEVYDEIRMVHHRFAEDHD